MPKHEMPFKDNDDCDRFDALDDFTRFYTQAIFFTECHGDNPELEHATYDDCAPEMLKEISDDCAAFQRDAGGLLTGLDQEQCGMDFWLTRNGHGAGFQDRGLGDVGDKLTALAKNYSSCGLYRGDYEGQLYLS